jgi:hypothetical protein
MILNLQTDGCKVPKEEAIFIPGTFAKKPKM